jgi:hypothetical protein
MARKANISKKRRLSVTLNGYEQDRLALIMSTGKWDTESEAFVTAMLRLADDVEHGEFSPEGRTIELH